MEFTNAQLEKAVSNHLKRLEYNKAWRERNPEKVKATRREYNKRKWQIEKAALAQAREAGLL